MPAPHPELWYISKQCLSPVGFPARDFRYYNATVQRFELHLRISVAYMTNTS